MKTPLLLACFAVAVTAAAAESKDATAIASGSNEIPAVPTPLFPGDLSLRSMASAPVIAPATPDLTHSDLSDPAPKAVEPLRRRVRPQPLFDAPRNRPPEILPDNMPPGTKAWRYGGQTYWLVPLIPSREKREN